MLDCEHTQVGELESVDEVDKDLNFLHHAYYPENMVATRLPKDPTVGTKWGDGPERKLSVVPDAPYGGRATLSEPEAQIARGNGTVESATWKGVKEELASTKKLRSTPAYVTGGRRRHQRVALDMYSAVACHLDR